MQYFCGIKISRVATAAKKKHVKRLIRGKNNEKRLRNFGTEYYLSQSFFCLELGGKDVRYMKIDFNLFIYYLFIIIYYSHKIWTLLFPFYM